MLAMNRQTSSPPAVGGLLRDWRRRRRMSQLDLALEAKISTRHLSFVETGRARPSAEMVLRLAEQLDVPLRERNELLLAAGFAPLYGSRDLDEPMMGSVRRTLDRLLAAHEPYRPSWSTGTGAWSPPTARSPCSRRRRGTSARAGGRAPAIDAEAAEIAVPLRIRHGEHELAFISTVTTFGTAVDITVSELSIESFFPADAVTARMLREAAAATAATAAPES